LIEAGTGARADFTLKMEPAYRIRGALANFVPHRTVKFELLSGDEDVSASRVSVNGTTGVFEIQDVVPGSYTLHVTQENTSAEIPVVVGGSDVSGIIATLASGVDLRVQTRFANEGEQGACMVSLMPSGHRGAAYSDAGFRRNPSGESTMAGVLPGVYRVSFGCFGVYVRSAMSGSQDLLANPLLTVQPGAQPPPIEILAAHGGGSVSGALSGNAKLEGAAVLLVPQFGQSTGPEIGPASPSGEQEGQFEFEFANLAPGSYMAYAFSDINDVEYRNPEFLRSLSGGVGVQVEDNVEKKIAITGVLR
jgi:uncharacterized protein (DUF2141 family)